jgi:hypothetical protein
VQSRIEGETIIIIYGKERSMLPSSPLIAMFALASVQRDTVYFGRCTSHCDLCRVMEVAGLDADDEMVGNGSDTDEVVQQPPGVPKTTPVVLYISVPELSMRVVHEIFRDEGIDELVTDEDRIAEACRVLREHRAKAASVSGSSSNTAADVQIESDLTAGDTDNCIVRNETSTHRDDDMETGHHEGFHESTDSGTTGYAEDVVHDPKTDDVEAATEQPQPLPLSAPEFAYYQRKVPGDDFSPYPEHADR